MLKLCGNLPDPDDKTHRRNLPVNFALQLRPSKDTRTARDVCRTFIPYIGDWPIHQSYQLHTVSTKPSWSNFRSVDNCNGIRWCLMECQARAVVGTSLYHGISDVSSLKCRSRLKWQDRRYSVRVELKWPLKIRILGWRSHHCALSY